LEVEVPHASVAKAVLAEWKRLVDSVKVAVESYKIEMSALPYAVHTEVVAVNRT
jgi:hypothetical protein